MNNKEMIQQRIRLKEVAPIWKNEGKICYHSDGFTHYQVKAALCYILRQKGHYFTTELEFENNKKADIFDLNKFVVYELESNYTKKDMQEKVDNFRKYDDVQDIHLIDPQKAPNQLDQLKSWLEDKLVL